jgi:AraC family transcriptional regulator of adaptative response / DNA-3-methyladenine glycosylase II
LEAALEHLRALPGVGLLRAKEGERPTPKSLLRRAEAWRPWRAYAAQ